MSVDLVATWTLKAKRPVDLLRAILARVEAGELMASKRAVARLEGAATALEVIGNGCYTKPIEGAAGEEDGSVRWT